MTRGVDEDVVGLDVPVDEAELVDGLDGEDALGHVELGHILRERVVLDQPAMDTHKRVSLTREQTGARTAARLTWS